MPEELSKLKTQLKQLHLAWIMQSVMVNTWLAAFSIRGSPFTLPELNLLQSDAPTASDTHPWLTQTSPSLTCPWFGLKIQTWSWCPLSWEHFNYSHNRVTHQRLPVTPQHIHSTDWSLQLTLWSLPCYCSPLCVQLWSQYIPWLTVHYHTVNKAVISLLQVAKKWAQMQYVQTFKEIYVAFIPELSVRSETLSPEAFYNEKVAVNVFKAHLRNMGL